MKKPFTAFFLFLTLSLFYNSFGQTIFIEEGFESGNIPDTWEQEKDATNKSWACTAGTGIPAHQPNVAAEGAYNASFYKYSINAVKTKLISPIFNLEFGIKPELHFKYAQYFFEDEFGSGNTKLSIYYRSVEEDNQWRKLKDFNEPTTDWTEGVILIPDSVRYSSLQIAFEGRIDNENEHGTCVDNIYIIETDTIPKFLNSISATQASTDLIPTGSKNNPILRLKMTVNGNDGLLTMNSIAVNLLLNATEIVPTDGIKLFATTSKYFNDTIQIGTSTSITGDVALFQNIGYDLPVGNSYLWITFDVPFNENHIFKGKSVDASISVNGILINNNSYPDIKLDPSGFNSIGESLFYDDFESAHFWDTIGEFQINKAIGLGGKNGYPDPSYAKSGQKIMGVDLTGLGVNKGDYEKSIGEKEYMTTLDSTIDATYYKRLNVGFYRWLNIIFSDTATIEISLDNGITYQNIFQNNGSILENQWTYQNKSIDEFAYRNSNIKLRFTLGPTGSLFPYSGWNIDNFSITGDFINKDAGITKLISPSQGCGHTGLEPIKVTVKNFGFDTLYNIPLRYSKDGGVSWVRDTLKTTLLKTATYDFEFKDSIDISTPGNHSLIVRTDLISDEDDVNDRIDTTIFVAPTYTLPYFENFETNNGYWNKGGANQTWEYGIPVGTKINKAYSGTKCWATNLDGNYTNNDSAWLESPCFNFSGIDKPIMDYMLWANGEIDKDGLSIYYTLNDGTDWNIVPAVGSYVWNWYNNLYIEALSHEGWDSTGNTWFKARQILPNDVANAALVKFRFVFQSNATNTKEGFAIDDIKFYNAPTDAGITAIVTPKNECSLSKTQDITVTVKNYGIRPIAVTDSLFAKVIINSTTTLTDTFIVSSPLAVDASTNFTFTPKANMFSKQWYKMKAYTYAKGDTAYYVAGIYNDTIVDSAYVKGEPYYTLGPDIGTYDADTVMIDGKTHSVGGADFIKYNWNNAGQTNDRYFDVPAFPVGIDYLDYTIEVENDSGCFIKDTIQIIKSNIDVGIALISGISDKCFNSQNQNLQVRLKNFSSFTLPKDTVIKVGYTLGAEANEEPYFENITLLSDFDQDKDTLYSFAGNPIYTVAGNYTLSAFTIASVDLDYSNDTATLAIEIYAMPTVNLGPDSILTLTANGTVLDAGLTSPPSTYLWQDNTSTTDQYIIPVDTSFMYSVTVTDAHTCGIASDSVLIVSDNWVLDSLISPISQCAPSNSEQVSVLLINKSPNTYYTGFTIPTQIKMNDSIINESIVLTGTLLPTDSIDYTFTHIFNMSEPMDYAFDITINPSHDINRNDNELLETISIWGIYPVDLGTDSIITKKADTLIFDAGSDYNTYLWQDASATQNFYVTSNQSLTYAVTVTDIHGCSNSSDEIKIVSYDIGVTEINTPSSQCELTGTNRIRLTLQNFGPDAIPTATKMSFFYNLNDGNWIEKEYTTNTELSSGASTNIILYEDIVFDSKETYYMKIYSSWNRDHFHDNDTASKIIYQYDTPTVNIGDDIYTTKPDTVILDAGTGQTTYTWQDGSHNQIFNVSYPATSQNIITVTNANGCFDTDTVNVYTYDISVASIESLNNCDTSSINPFTMNIQLNSADTLHAGNEIAATYEFNSTPITETIVLTDTFTRAAPLSYAFAAPFTVSDTGNFSITASVEMVNEVVTNNNNLTTNFRIGAYPVNLGNDSVTYESSITLDAGSGFTSYLWSDESSEQTLEVSLPGNYNVTTTDVNSCAASDSINVLFLNPGYEITEITGLKDSCQHAENEIIEFSMQNTGNDTITSGSIIPISYQINTLTAIEENYTFTQNLNPGNSVSISFATVANLSESATYAILTAATIAGKTTSLDSIINTWPAPSIDLGNDIQSTADSVILDAGAGFSSYLWTTAAEIQTIEVRTDGDYGVTVTNSNGCANSDMINVHFIPASLFISKLVNPLLGCEKISNEKPTLIVKNGGSRIIPIGTSLNFGYQVEDQVRVDEINELETIFPIDALYTYEFNTPLNIENTSSVNISFFIKIDAEDMDTLKQTIPIYGKPEFFDGQDTLKTNAYPYIIDSKVVAESYLWNTNETTSTISINQDGEYWLTITEDNTCNFTDSVYVKIVTGIHESWTQQISVYPNPGESKVWIDLPENTGKVTLKITDLNGKVIYSKKDVSIDFMLDISAWDQGIYILRINNSEQYGMYQIIKQ